MKQKRDTTNKKRESSAGKTAKPVCGTLSYLAECRGTLQKTESTRWTAPPYGIKSNERK
jgi:hypothetical protein